MEKATKTINIFPLVRQSDTKSLGLARLQSLQACSISDNYNDIKFICKKSDTSILPLYLDVNTSEFKLAVRYLICFPYIQVLEWTTFNPKNDLDYHYYH
jgi:hypothetical protein